jgi:hypothetical protein
MDGTSVAQNGWDFDRLLRAGLRLLVIVGGGFIAFPLDSAPLRITAKSLPIPASPTPPNSHPNLARKSVNFPFSPPSPRPFPVFLRHSFALFYAPLSEKFVTLALKRARKFPRVCQFSLFDFSLKIAGSAEIPFFYG